MKSQHSDEDPNPEAAVTDPLAADVASISKIGVVETVLEVICRITEVGFAAVARVTDQRWIACAVRDEIHLGIRPGDELVESTTLCHDVRESGQVIVIDHASQDEKYRAHATPRQYGFESYISVPLRRTNGSFFGTLCALDRKPVKLSGAPTVNLFILFAQLIAFHLDLEDRLASRERELSTEREMALMRERFVATLGHDLRNPLTAIGASTAVLATLPFDAPTVELVSMIQESCARLIGIVDKLHELARVRLGGGLFAPFATNINFNAVLERVVREFHALAPGCRILTHLEADPIVSCDAGLIAQLLSNLIANALEHGDSTRPVEVCTGGEPGVFQLTVVNRGYPIPAHTLSHLFEPFARSASRSSRQGLGLGLYIAFQIARAHGATLEVHSDDLETRVTLRLPRSSNQVAGVTSTAIDSV